MFIAGRSLDHLAAGLFTDFADVRNEFPVLGLDGIHHKLTSALRARLPRLDVNRRVAERTTEFHNLDSVVFYYSRSNHFHLVSLCHFKVAVHPS